MQKALVLFFIVALASLAVAQDHDGFIGTWSGSFGLTVKLCITDGQARLEGSFNDFGVIQAELSDFGETANGNFYGTYYQTDSECDRGEFSWHLNGNTITGEYTCFDGLSAGEWNLNRVIPQIRPSTSECYVLNDSADDNDIEGAWNYDFSNDDEDDWDICIEGDEFFASYGEPGTPGATYQFGKTFEGNRLLSGSYITILDEYSNIQTGGSMILLTEKTDLVSFNWASPNSLSRVITANPGSHFTFSGVEKSGRSSSARDCERNAALSIGYPDDDDYYVSDSSSASTLIMGLGYIFAIFALF